MESDTISSGLKDISIKIREEFMKIFDMASIYL
jgi:hypothetical protein